MSNFILKNSANNSVFNSIFNSRSSNSTSIHQLYDSALTRLRLQSFGIRLDDEPQVGTPLRQCLPITYKYFLSDCHERAEAAQDPDHHSSLPSGRQLRGLGHRRAHHSRQLERLQQQRRHQRQ